MAGLRHCFFLYLLITIGYPVSSLAQTVRIHAIEFEGLRRTKPIILHRELTFALGDTLPQLQLGDILERNRHNLINLGIFNDVEVNISEWNTDTHEIDILITVRESWYVYAVPILELADRNFNVWWNTYNGSLRRLNLGAQLEILNFSGRNDKFKTKLQFGFTPKQEIEYRFPYLGKKQHIGITTGMLHSINKEIAFQTIDNKEAFIRLDERNLMERWLGDVSIVYRPSLFLRYELYLAYQTHRTVEEISTEYNPNFFRNPGITHKALTTTFIFDYDDRDVRIYPARGIRGTFELKKIGWQRNGDENLLESFLMTEYNHPLGRRWQYRLTAMGQYNVIRQRPSYLHYKALGNGQKYIRGYELYLIDGMDFVIGKGQVSYKFLQTKINWGKRIPMTAFRVMPVTMYASLFAETGYVNDPYTFQTNPMSNRWLYGGGPGLDVIFYNNFLFQFNFSVNHLGEWGLFVHNKTSF